MVKKIRLDVLMTEQNLVESRNLAQRLVMAGQVRVAGQVVLKPSQQVDLSAVISIDTPPAYVSRGGEKLEAAIQAFGLTDLAGLTCVDVGASTGGFTDCLLQHGAVRVYAIDVGYGVLHWKLRQDPRVISMEKTNARFVSGFPEKIDLVTIDASFISLKVLLPTIKAWLGENARILALIKPQFEVGRAQAARGEGVIRNPELHRTVLIKVLEEGFQVGLFPTGLIRSPLLGPKGNTEFLVLWSFIESHALKADDLIAALFPENGKPGLTQV
jgi:23S rRNA (cytidine1920-2'-O)/16S rRNA (cytidine1409-2'-O)-methyltransferase